jgi:ketosteroid isomerase-like protein
MPHLAHRVIHIFLLTIVTFSISAALAQGTDDTAEIGRLLRAGQTEQAAARVEQALASRPRDTQLRFLRGVIQIEQKRNNDAIVTFQRMTEDFPELPEPYNNLAVLFAGQGQYDKARAALELAIRTHPSYATAHENLGDVYTKMASESYTKALQLDSGNNGAQVKLNVIKDLSTAKPGKPSPAPTSASAAVLAATPVASAAAKPSPMPAVSPATVASAPIVSAAKSTAIQPADKLTDKPVAKADESDAAYAAVVKWAKAWSNKNVEAYLASYGKAFVPSNGENRNVWEVERRNRIEGKRNINLILESPSVKVNGDSATVKFRQKYQADNISTNSRKTLKMSKADGSWKIVEELTGR